MKYVFFLTIIVLGVGIVFVVRNIGDIASESPSPSPITSVVSGATPFPTHVPSPTPSPRSEQLGVIHDVPFTSQAPRGQWDDPRFQDGCEEASVLMAIKWVRGESLSISEAELEIIRMSSYAERTFGTYHDIGLEDTVRYLTNFYGHSNVSAHRNISINDIIAELDKGNVVLTPMQGQWLENPYFSPPGPEYHFLLVKGYDPVTREFITNDPGTRHGESYRYSYNQFFNAIREYKTGYHLPVETVVASMIVVGK